MARRPALPPGRDVEIPGGTVHVRELTGPPGAPAIVLLHGWTATADLNFFACYAGLGRHFRVLAFDQRGHGRGLRSRRPFRLADCADDVAAVTDAVGLERVIVVGYSMGGAVAQLVWRRHPSLVRGLVLGATAAGFRSGRTERLSFLGLTGLAALARLTPSQARQWLTGQLYLQRKTDTWEPWAIGEASSHDWRMVLEAGHALGQFRAHDWLAEIDVPTSVLLTMRDEIVPLRRQLRLLDTIPGAAAFRVDAGHDAPVRHPRRFVPVLVDACNAVAARAP